MDKPLTEYIVDTATLADIFQVSERQIQRLVNAGVIEPAERSAQGFKFDLFTVTPQYISFLQCRTAGTATMGTWAPDSK